MAPAQKITDIVLLSFLTNTAPQNVYFIVHYHLFLRQKIEYLYFSNYSTYSLRHKHSILFLCRQEIKLVFKD